jgi:hypothetical protein
MGRLRQLVQNKQMRYFILCAVQSPLAFVPLDVTDWPLD